MARKKLPGEIMKERREELNMTQQEVANKVAFLLQDKGITFSQESYYRYEACKVVRYPYETMKAIGTVLGISAEKILGEEDWLAHLSEEEKAFLRNPKCVPFIREAMIEYLRDKNKKEEK